MTYETGTAVDLEDLLSKLDTFAQTTHGGWSSAYSPNPNNTNGWFELNKGSLSFSMKFPVGAQGPPQHASVHHATGSLGAGVAPGQHNADSGNGYNSTDTGQTNANMEDERCVNEIGNGPFPSYHFFADDTANDYIHAVVEVSTSLYRHLPFGTLDRFGDNWVGGEYVCGHFMEGSSSQLDSGHTGLLDGQFSDVAGVNELRAATVRIASGLPNVSPAFWGCAIQRPSAQVGLDTAGNVRRQISGSFRVGLEPRGFASAIGNFSSGLVPMYSVAAYYRDPTTPEVYLLGHMPDVRVMNIRNFVAAQEITVGTDTWVLFPWSLKTAAVVPGRSGNMGIAYLKRV